MEKIQWNINGVSNNQMKTALKNALNKVEGVSMIDIDMAREKIEVGYNEPATEQEIRESIENSGFSIE